MASGSGRGQSSALLIAVPAASQSKREIIGVGEGMENGQRRVSGDCADVIAWQSSDAGHLENFKKFEKSMIFDYFR